MTNQQARNLLRRKKLRGDELGRALLLSFVMDYQQRDAPASQPLFTQQELTLLVAALPSEWERRRYAGYGDLYHELSGLYTYSQGQVQQLENGMGRLFFFLSLSHRLYVLQRALPQSKPYIETIFPESLGHPQEGERYALDSRALREKVLIPAYRWLLGYNKVLSLLAQIVSLPALNLLAVEMQPYQEDAGTHDSVLHTLEGLLQSDGQEDLLRHLRAAFSPLLDGDTLRLPNEGAASTLLQRWQTQEPEQWNPTGAIGLLLTPGEEA